MKYNKTLLCILDGFAFGNINLKERNPVSAAKMPFLKKIYGNKMSNILAHGKSVGLKGDMFGNSEVGHKTMGLGMVRESQALKVGKFFSSIRDKNLKENEHPKAYQKVKKFVSDVKKKIHVIGMLSSGNVHCSTDVLVESVKALSTLSNKEIHIHIITDGRDDEVNASKLHIKKIRESLKEVSHKISSASGRYWSMDRDMNLDRTLKYYNTIRGNGDLKKIDIESWIEKFHNSGVSDEFIEPVLLDKGSAMEDGDSVFICNFRPDRMRQLACVLNGVYCDQLSEYKASNAIKTGLHCCNMINYFNLNKKHLKNKSLFLFDENESLNNGTGQLGLGYEVSKCNLTQLRISETEKYAHVTFFFSGGTGNVFPGEKRVLIKSSSDKAYDLNPEMKISELCLKLFENMKEHKDDLIVLNIPNCDMVGHTGSFEASIKALEAVDNAVHLIAKKCKEFSYRLAITADHGNIEESITKSGLRSTSHTKNPVPLWCFNENGDHLNLKKSGELANIAPTVLSMIGIKIPKYMSDTLLIEKK